MRKTKYTYDVMKSVVEQSTSIRNIIQLFGLKVTGGTYTYMSTLIRKYELDTSHFLGQGWAKGQTKETCAAVRRPSATDLEILVENTPVVVSKMKLRAIVKQYKAYICEVCTSEPIWLGEPLTLHLDHINGITNDNRLENLRFICPNCHQQTPTWGKKKLVR